MELSAKETLDGERDHLRVAHTILKLDDLTQKQILLDASHKFDLVLPYTRSCCKHEQIMKPDLWSTLPVELLQQVFAKLPILDICRLKFLSKEWLLSLRSSSSEFTQALKESSPKILGRVNLGGCFRFRVQVLDGRTNRWYASHIYAPGCPGNRRQPISVDEFVHMDGAADGGLVCCVEKDFKTGLNRIFVTNPMTGIVKELPNLKVLMYSELTMMRIIVDRGTFHYEVIVVKPAQPVEAEVYDSDIQQGTTPKASLGRIFGTTHNWSRHGNVWSARKSGPCAYDCRDEKYYDFILDQEKWLGSRDGMYYDFEQDQEKWLGMLVLTYTLMEDRLFVLYWDREEQTAFISEYYVPDNATSWVKKETYSCFPCYSRMMATSAAGFGFMTRRIHACNGFLFLSRVGRSDFEDDKKLENGDVVSRVYEGKLENAGIVYSRVYEEVYDLATCECLELPRSPGWTTRKSQFFLTNVMCELHWNILP